MEFIASLLADLGSKVAETSESGCFAAFFDEPECPESLIK